MPTIRNNSPNQEEQTWVKQTKHKWNLGFINTICLIAIWMQIKGKCLHPETCTEVNVDWTLSFRTARWQQIDSFIILYFREYGINLFILKKEQKKKDNSNDCYIS